MAILIHTRSPAKLLEKIKSAIANEHIKTWAVDDDGDFTHSVQQWRYKAWLRPTILSGALRLHILCPVGQALSKTTYAVYHGRFIESVLTHFDEDIERCEASAMPESGDRVSGS